MKFYKIFILLISSFIISSCGSMKELPTNQLNLQKVYKLPGFTKKQIYDKVAEWMAKTYVSSKEVIQLKDPVNGKIIGRGITSFNNILVSVPCEYSISVEAKDNKYRVTFAQFIALWGSGRQPLEREGYVNDVKENLTILSENLYSFIKNSKNDNW